MRSVLNCKVEESKEDKKNMHQLNIKICLESESG